MKVLVVREEVDTEAQNLIGVATSRDAAHRLIQRYVKNSESNIEEYENRRKEGELLFVVNPMGKPIAKFVGIWMEVVA